MNLLRVIGVLFSLKTAPDETLLTTAADAIRGGDVGSLKRKLAEHPGLAAARIGPRTLLHVATDWPGHFPNVAATIAVLAEAGADLNAHFIGRQHAETPLHWAASSDDVDALDALLDAGADIEATGSIIGGGTALADAVAFGQWKSARRLVERGARVTFWQAAGLGLMDRLEEEYDRTPPPSPDDITNAFWCACHGGQRQAAESLLARGANLNWVGYNNQTPLDVARKSGAEDVVAWLQSKGAQSSGCPPSRAE